LRKNYDAARVISLLLRQQGSQSVVVISQSVVRAPEHVNSAKLVAIAGILISLDISLLTAVCTGSAGYRGAS
ncbi:hypothetical protein OS493_039672, partial [Desmophyllum pertusum]